MSDTTAPPKPEQERRAVDTAQRGGRARKQTRWAQFSHRHLGSILALVGFVVVWQLYVTIASPNPRLVPGPGAVVGQLVAMHELGFIVPAFTASMKAYFLGTSIAVVLGITLALAIGMSRVAHAFAMPYLWAAFSMPRTAIIPLLLVWVGIGWNLVLLSIVTAAAVPLIIQILEGMRTIDGSALRMSRSFTGSRWDTLRKVILPGTVPYIANGMRLCLARGFIGLIVVEMLVGTEGLGMEAMRASRAFNTARTMAMIVVLLVVSTLIVIVSNKIEESVSGWRETVDV